MHPAATRSRKSVPDRAAATPAGEDQSQTEEERAHRRAPAPSGRIIEATRTSTVSTM